MRSVGFGSKASLFGSLSSSGNASLFCGAGFSSKTSLFGNLSGSGNASLFCRLEIGRNPGRFGSLRLGSRALLFGDQGFIDDHRLQIGGTLLHHQRTMVVQLGRRAAIIVQNGILCAGGHFSSDGRRTIGNSRLGNGSGVSRNVGLNGSRGGLRCLWLDSLSLFFLAAETQPGKQTFCHLKILTSKADC